FGRRPRRSGTSPSRRKEAPGWLGRGPGWPADQRPGGRACRRATAFRRPQGQRHQHHDRIARRYNDWRSDKQRISRAAWIDNPVAFTRRTDHRLLAGGLRGSPRPQSLFPRRGLVRGNCGTGRAPSFGAPFRGARQFRKARAHSRRYRIRNPDATGSRKRPAMIAFRVAQAAREKLPDPERRAKPSRGRLRPLRRGGLLPQATVHVSISCDRLYATNMLGMVTMAQPWPSISYAEWRETCAALHLWSQIVGKYRLAHTPWVNPSWHATLYVTPRGLTTGPIPDGSTLVTLKLDFCDHLFAAEAERGARATFPLRAMSVAGFYSR